LHQTVNDILNGPDYFLCEKFGTRMPKRDCVKRQTEGQKFYVIPGYKKTCIISKIWACENCEQGMEIRNQMSGVRCQPPSSGTTARQVHTDGG